MSSLVYFILWEDRCPSFFGILLEKFIGSSIFKTDLYMVTEFVFSLD
jgi:hypothetical protein